MEIKVLYEDGDLVVLDKPAGIVVNRAESVKDFTIQDYVEREILNLKSEIRNPKQIPSTKSKVSNGNGAMEQWSNT